MRVANKKLRIKQLICLLTVLLASGIAESNNSTVPTITGYDNSKINLHTNSNASFKVDVWPDKENVGLGDNVVIYFMSSKDCYLYLYDIGTSGKTTLIWPNKFTGFKNNFVKAGQVHSFPPKDAPYRFELNGPDGIEKIIASATLKPMEIIDSRTMVEQGGFKKYTGSVSELEEAFKDFSVKPNRPDWTASQVSIPVSNTYIVGIGINKGELSRCDSDVKSFVTAIKTNLRVAEKNIRIILNEEATLDGIRKTMRWLRESTRDDSTVFFYYSGYGTQTKDRNNDEEDGYDEAFVPVNAEDGVAETLYLDDEFRMDIEKVRAKQKIIVIDSSYSKTGGSDLVKFNAVSKYYLFQPSIEHAKSKSVLSNGDFFDIPQAVSYRSNKSKNAVLLACRDSQNAMEVKGKGGLFTHNLVSLIRNGSNLERIFFTSQKKVESKSKYRQVPQIFDPDKITAKILFNVF